MELTDKQKEILKANETHHGFRIMALKTIEECAELTDAILKHRAGRDTANHVCEELADVFICVSQLAEMLGEYNVTPWIEYKVKRVEERLKMMEDAR